MSRDQAYRVRHRSISPLGETNHALGVLNLFGAQVVVDLYTQWFLSGFCFHMQCGTEDAPVTTQGPLDDTKPFILADNNSGIMVPLVYDVNIAGHTTSTAVEAMLEVDMDKKRFSSGTTSWTPEQMNNAATTAPAANGTFYTTDGGDITAAAKSAVPASVELARRTFSEDAITTLVGEQMGLVPVFSVRTQLPVLANTPSSICCHFGSATADATGYATLNFAQFSATLAW